MKSLIRSGTRHRGAILVAMLALGASALAGPVARAAGATAPMPTAASTQTPRPILLDEFDRSAVSAWGRADLGGLWGPGVTADPATQLAVTPGAARMANGPGHGAEALSPTTASDTNMAIGFTVPTVSVAGSGFYLYLEQRVQSDATSKYAARVRVLPNGDARISMSRLNGQVQTLIGSEISVGPVHPGQHWRLESRVTGAGPVTLAVRAYPFGTTAPGWQYSSTDATAQAIKPPGRLGLFSYQSGSATTPTTVTIQSVEVDDLAPASRAASHAGAQPIGTASYPAPADALYVAPGGLDTQPGSLAAPVRTLSRAIALAPTGRTIVLRAGEYNQTATIPAGKSLTIQNYPGEAAYLDGATHVNTGWVQTGSTWTRPGWTAQFDNTPTDSPTTPTGAGWSFVGPQNPLAHHADQAWIDGLAQTLVASAATVAAGQFYVDYAAHTLVVGSNPTGHDIKAANLVTGLTVNGSGSTVRGIGIRDYADSLDRYGALVVANAAGVTLTNIAVTANATYGIAFSGSPGGTVANVTADGNGLLGMGSYHADNLTISASRFDGNNTHHFNQAPKSGGYKSDDTRGIAVTDSQFANNAGPGMWFDQSTYGVTAARNDVIANAGHGVSFEISAKLLFVDNLVLGSGDTGLKLNDANGLSLYNNTIAASGSYNVWIVQDSRVASNLSVPGHDARQSLPDPTMTWIVGDVVASNNVFGTTSAAATFMVQDSALHRTAAQMGLTLDGNLYLRSATTSPATLVGWPQGGANPTDYPTVVALHAGTGQEPHGYGLDINGLNSDGTLMRPALLLSSVLAQTLPVDIAALAGVLGTRAGIGG